MSSKVHPIELGLGSTGKMKIIRALAEESKLVTVYLLHKKTRLKRDDIKSNLDDLIKIGWVKQTKLPNAIYGLDRENETVKQILDFFDTIGYTGQP